MRDARPLLIVVGAALAFSLSACGREEPAEENQVITDINTADPGDIEAVPPDESVDPLPADNGAETGDGDDMVNIVDDTGNRG